MTNDLHTVFWVNVYDRATDKTRRFAVRALTVHGAYLTATDLLSKGRTEWSELELEVNGQQIVVFDR